MPLLPPRPIQISQQNQLLMGGARELFKSGDKSKDKEVVQVEETEFDYQIKNL